ncbi:MAG: DUF6340 family protein [Hymenobacteraceae bacterium]|nr:DUF6340 family protein [Hymenobacteraceae bacterium]
MRKDMGRTTIYSLLGLLLALSQVSCTSVLFIESTQPPEVEIAHEQWKVVAINRYNPELLTFKREKKVEVYAEGAREAFTGALDAILLDDTYRLIAADTTTYLAQTPEEPLNPEQVRAIYQKHPHHLLLSLDGFDTFFDQETVHARDTDGHVSKTAHYTLVTKTSWTLFDSTGTVLDQVTLYNEELYNSRAVLSGLLAIGPSMANAGPEVNRLAWYTGNDYWKRLSPTPVSIIRSYYSNKTMQPAAERMAAGNWANAIQLLRPMTESGSKKEARRAAYNLAVVYEAMGNIREAKVWARYAQERGDRLATYLLPDLENYGH